jgi:hypothetical protein
MDRLNARKHTGQKIGEVEFEESELTGMTTTPLSKSEIRNPKLETNPNLQWLKARNAMRGAVLWSFLPWCVGFVSDFGFKAPDLRWSWTVVIPRCTRALRALLNNSTSKLRQLFITSFA